MKTYYETSTKPIEIIYFSFNSSFFTNLGLAFFCYVNQFALHTIFGEMKGVNRLGHYSIVLRSSYLPLFLYLMITISMTISLGQDIPSFAVLRPAIQGVSNVPMFIAQLGVFTVITFNIVIKTRCIGELALSVLTKKNIVKLDINSKPKKFVRIITNGIIAYTAMIISFFIKDNATDVISLFSSFTCNYYIVICPSNI